MAGQGRQANIAAQHLEICSQAAVDGVIFEFSELTTAFAPGADELLLCY
jgi:hypothetical protein